MSKTDLPRRLGGIGGIVLLACAGATGKVLAQETESGSSSRALERITITGDPDRIQEIPGSAQSLDREQLDRFSHGDAHRVLRQIPGINIQEEEGFGLFPNIGMRGGRVERNTRITVMEDGVLIAPAPYSAPAAYYFPPIGRMDSVEVRKGSSSIKYGPYTTSGALNMLSTPIPTENFAAKADVLFGSNNGRRNHVWLGGSDDQWGWLVEGYTQSSDGFKDLDTPRRSGNNMPDDNTGFDQRSLMGKLRWNTAPTTPVYQEVEVKAGVNDMNANESYLGLTLDDFRDDPYRRYAGSGADAINTEHQQFQLRHYIAPTDNVDITTTAYYNQFARNWYKLGSVQNTPGANNRGISSILSDPDDPNNAGAFDWITGNGQAGQVGFVRANNREYYSKGVQSQLGYLFNTGDIAHELEVGLRYHMDEEDRLQWEDEYEMQNGSMVLTSRGTPGSQTNRVTDARALAAFAQDTMRFGNWTVVPGLRYEQIRIKEERFQDGANPDRSVTTATNRADYDVLIPGIGATYQLSPEWSVLAGVHRGFAPTGAGSDGEEERSTNYEAGFRYRTGNLRSEAIGFFNKYSNLVGTCTAASGGGCDIGDTFSGGKVDVYGLEALALYDLGAARGLGMNIPLSIAYTWTQTEFKEAGDFGYAPWGDVQRGDELPQVPEHQITASAGVINGPWAGNVAVNYVAAARATAGSGSIPRDDKLESRVLVDVAGEYAFTDNVKAFGSVENLLDEEYVAGWRPAGARPGMPRTFWAGMKVRY
ncbi:MAG: TonB-dependent receptor [Aquisalimonadaceae bacterium]